MKVLFDYQIFQNQKFGGISRYFSELMIQFDSLEDIESQVGLFYSSNQHIANRYGLKNKIIKNLRIEGRTPFRQIISRKNMDFSKRIIIESKFSIFHPTYYDNYFLTYLKEPFVLTVYDMIHEKLALNAQFRNDSTSQQKLNLCKRANRIICISNQTKEDLIEIFNIPQEKIDVVYLAESVSDCVNSPSVSFTLPDRYILFVGNRRGYKNFKNFFEAIIPILKRDSSLFLVCIGPKFSKEEQELFSRLLRGIKKKIINLFVKDDQISHVYKNAEAFIFPSLYEGFGIPILEAFASECPAIISNIPVFNEIAKDGAFYFNPNSFCSMQDSIEKVIYNDELSNSLRKKGSERLKFFGWNKTAKETIEVYKKV